MSIMLKDINIVLYVEFFIVVLLCLKEVLVVVLKCYEEDGYERSIVFFFIMI